MKSTKGKLVQAKSAKAKSTRTKSLETKSPKAKSIKGTSPKTKSATSKVSRSRSYKHRKPVLGWKEWVTFPAWGIDGIRCKVDTGARTSALHATELEEAEEDGERLVRFKLQCERRTRRRPVALELPLVDRRPVRDSSGREELRPVVYAEVEVGGERAQIEVTLTRRDDMEFNMLLGRRAVRGRFLVDPSRIYIFGDPPPGSVTTPRKRSAAKKSKPGTQGAKTPAKRRKARK